MMGKLAISGVLAGVGTGLMLLGLVAGFVPQRDGPEVRRSVNLTVAQLRPEEVPLPIVSVGQEGWSLRAPISSVATSAAAESSDVSLTPLAPRDPAGGLAGSPDTQWVTFTDEGVSLATTEGPRVVEGELASASYVPVLPLEDMGMPVALVTIAPVDYGESLTIDGRPLRWLAEQSAALRRLEPECDREQLALEERTLALLPRYPFDAEDSFTRARRYKEMVGRAAQRFGLNEALVYAIIQTESNFSPVLVSSQSAMGLMQLLPSTAGGEVHTFLYGHPSKVTFNDLANPEVNIRYGTAYLHLLLTRHLGGVKDVQSREYCALAAYNMGPNRFLRLFSPDRDTAIEIINAMTPEALFRRLTTELPVLETRAYVAKVSHRRGEFESFQ